MAKKNRAGALSDDEKRIVKTLLVKKWRNQDIQALINIGRSSTVNSARVTGVKSDKNQPTATDEEVERYFRIKESYEAKTGLNPFFDERLIRAREAMLLAVNVFNNSTLQFRSEVFCVLSNIAWTYLLHEHYDRKGVTTKKENGYTLSLSEMIARADCPLSSGMKSNLEDMKRLRDKVEHSLLSRSDILWMSLFQANCLNFDKAICEIFGSKLTLQGELSFALHFSKLDLEQIEAIQKYDVPSDISALNQEMLETKNNAEREDLEYRFSVVYTMCPTSKAKAAFHFVSPESEEAEQISNILIKYKSGDHLYPYKAGRVCKLVRKKSKSRFAMHDHTQAWKKYKIRPNGGAPDPKKTNRKYCTYHPAHGDYTYNDDWVEFLVSKLKK